MASNAELPSGYDYEFVVQVPEDYICSICHLAMLKPVQTRCGHRFCKGCLDAALQRKRKCPLDNEFLTSKQIFEDKATERQILSLKIKCPNHCDWQGEMRDVKTHDEKCPLAIVPCSYVSIGCKFKAPRRSLSDHYKNKLADHLELTTQQLLTLRVENINLKKQVLELKASNYTYTWKISDFSQQLQFAKEQDHGIKLYSEPFYTHKYEYKLKLRLNPYGDGAGKGTHVSVFMIIMQGEYDAILTWPFNWKHKFTLLDQKPDPSKRKNIDHGYINPDTSMDSFQRPTTDENLGYGYPEFVSHEIIKTENYVVDGAVFIKLEWENPSMQN
ncbi:TNF receptor-associated factor 3 isoform X2 [Exaiptasia diaphana]|uniref:Uncharacterized protein n=1 Tax=Exaiptasia diaphana TaxID=2652724 RepID=A0A913WPU0_EXADI|nr:TNF receptor-associated factor 3 isoform X2 [Exaiptasia diaphana]